MNHEELVGLAKTHLSGVPFEYEGDAIPVLSPCRFTGSEVRYLGANFIILNLNKCSCCLSELFLFASGQVRMRDDDYPLAHVAIAVEGPGVASPDVIPLMVANAIIGSFDLTYGGGKVGERVQDRGRRVFCLKGHFGF